MTIVEDTILSVIYVASGTVYSITPEIARGVNATGLPSFKRHPFEHPFLLMALEFLAQALCIPLWLIITGGYTPPRNPHIRNYDDRGPRYDDVEEHPAPEDDADDQILVPADAGIQANGNVVVENIAARNDGDDEMINVVGENDQRPGRRPPVEPNNPAWNQRPVDQTKFNMFLFVVPAFFDLSRYGLLYIAFKLTYRSSFMMIRSASVLFTVLLRVAFLSKHMAKYMWVSIGMVVVGLGLIGMTDFVHKTPPGYDKYGIAAGCLLMVMSQIMIAMQIVYEEKFMDKHSIHPLRVVGLEGCFGSVVAVIMLLPFSFISSGPFSVLQGGRIVDIKDAFLQMKSSWIIALCVVGKVVSKVVYYYTGTRFVRNQHDAAKRITIDVHHDLIIWVISLVIAWQNYFYPQIIGFILVPIGMLVYCDVIPLPELFRPPAVPPPAGPLQEHEQLQLNAQNNRRHAAGEGEGELREEQEDDHDNPEPQIHQ
ncbi:solute carrier family 35 member F6-like isoform X2 [Littorina saxatilis]|uniref:EamA domain-containing protein n=1 Tax=Littorina saxatilis TaxID=31220 RepID=A0AAN9G3L4_9CAEN